jgi:hypothetical protein
MLFIYILQEKMLNYEYISPLISSSIFFSMFVKIGCHTHGIFWTASFDTLAKSLSISSKLFFREVQ